MKVTIELTDDWQDGAAVTMRFGLSKSGEQDNRQTPACRIAAEMMRAVYVTDIEPLDEVDPRQFDMFPVTA